MNAVAPGALTQKLREEYVRVLGKNFVDEFALRTWPMWDPTMGVVIFVDGSPVFISSSVLEVFDALVRCDVIHVPLLEGTDWEYYGINEHTLPRIAKSNNVAVVFLGDREDIAPYRPFELHEADALINAGSDVFLAGREAMNSSTYQACYIRHDGYVLEMDPKLPRSLGYEAGDNDWIPAEWFEPQPLGPATVGRSLANDDSETMLDWTLVTSPNFNLYWVRKSHQVLDGNGDMHSHNRSV